MGKVLPGFQFRFDDLFTKPFPNKMISDKVYQDFVLPGYALAKKQASAEKRVRQASVLARRKAEQRALEAENENARLKALLDKLQKVR